MPQSVRRLLLVLVAVVASVALPRPVLAQSVSENAVAPAIPFVMQNVSFVNDADQGTTGAPPPQHKHHEGLGIGIKLGPIFSGYTGSGGLSLGNKTGFQFSLFLGGNRPGVFGVATEITFINRGANAVGQNTTSSSMKALEIPLLFRFNFGAHDLSHVAGYFMFGPAIDINLSNFAFSALTNNSGYDINLIFAGGVEITRFIIEIRYNKGLKAISSNLDNSVSVKTHAIVLLFGVRFN